MDCQYFINHPSVSDPNFSKTYSLYRRLSHNHHYLICMYIIDVLEKDRYGAPSEPHTMH